jgi:signal transduction histidine kinase
MSWRVSDWTLHQRLVWGLGLVVLGVLLPLGALLFWQLQTFAHTQLPLALNVQVEALLPIPPDVSVPTPPNSTLPALTAPPVSPPPDFKTRPIPDWCNTETLRQQFAAQLGVGEVWTKQFCDPKQPLPVPVAPTSKLLAVSAAEQVMSDLIGSVLLSFGIASGLLLFLTIWLGRRWLHQGLAPLRQIATQTANLSGQALGTRLPIPQPRDELRTLSLGLNEMLSRLQHSFQTAEARGRVFAAEASHELRTPITALRGQLELLGRLQDDPQVRHKLIGTAEREADRIARLVNELLTITHLDAGTTLQPQVILLPEWLEALSDKAQTSMVNVAVLVSSPSCTLHADPEWLERALWNLLSNAVRYGAPEQPVVLMAEADTQVVLSVFNAGDTISEAVQTRMFERFFRAPETRHRAASGVGLGLAIVQAVARAHQGDVFVQSPCVHRGVVGSKVGLRLPRLDNV